MIRSRPVRPLGVPFVVAILTLGSLSLAPAAAADPPDPPPGQQEPAPAGTAGSYRVTLITGDTVRLDVSGDGTHRATLVDRASGSGFYQSFTDRGDAYVVPSAAMSMLAADQLDPALFNVSSLVAQGLDDRRSATLPLLLTYDDPAAAAAPLGRGPALAGTTGVRELPSVNGLAVTADRSRAGELWDAVAGEAPASPPGPAPQARPAAAGIAKVWLDAQVTGSIDQSVPLVGAPAAWQRGYDGSGVTVAVLDTGIDPTHPDLRDQIAGGRDFTGKGNTVDGYGHGTHVSSILAGTGAASDGRYRGVAPGADLLAGKVLNDFGQGLTSWVISGMEWAAQSGADVVNLSLGGAITTGEDPASVALDTLTEQYGTLFVVAAGNRGPHDSLTHNVTSPAVAETALAVGASSGDGWPTGFTRDGVMGQSRVKPEIVAPGWNITAARAAGTCCGDDPYISHFGTSMAAPHVAGAAAILAQQYPEWTPAELKTGLVSAADPLDFGLPYLQGTGRLNLDRATGAQVRVDAGVLDYGYHTRPFAPGELTIERTLSYTNEGDAPVTLDLATRLKSQFEEPADEALSVQPDRLTLAAGATGTVRVTADATDLPGNRYGGWVTARYGDGRQLVTGLGFYKEDDTVDVTFRMVDRHGAPAFGTLRVSQYRDFNNGLHYPQLLFFSPQQSEWTLQLPENVYNVFGTVVTVDESGRFAEEYSVVGDPELEVSGPPRRTITLDARTANPLRAVTPRPTETHSTAVTWYRGGDTRNPWRAEGLLYFVFDGGRERLSIAPVAEVREDPFQVMTTFGTAAPLVEATVDAPRDRGRPDPVPLVYSGGPLGNEERELRLVDAGTARPEDLTGRDLTGAAALVREAADGDWQRQIVDVAAAGAEAVILYSAAPGVFWPDLRQSPISAFTLSGEEGARLRDLVAEEPATLRLVERWASPYRFTLTRAYHQALPSDVVYRPRWRDLARIDHRVHEAGVDPSAWSRQVWSDACACATARVSGGAAVGRVHTEYVTADPDLSVERGLRLEQLGTLVRYETPAPAGYRPGERVTEEWLAAPLAPGVYNSEPGGDWRAVRYRGLIDYSLPTWMDTAGHGASISGFGSLASASRLYRAGEDTPIHQSESFIFGRVTVPTEPGDYRLEVDTDHDGSELDLSTRTRTVWRFHSEPPADNREPEVLPLVDLDYTGLTLGRFGNRPALDLANRAGSGSLVSLGLRVGHQAGADAPPVADTRVWVSYDDGGQWRPVPVVADPDGGLRAVYRHPPGSSGGYVSLRVQAADGAGNTLEQTIIRAYGLD